MHEVPIAPQHPDGFSELIDPDDMRRYRRALADAAAGLDGRTWWHVNSTAEGGGVAELLHALLGYVVASDIDARWMVIEGDPAFFEVTKRIHNRLHGNPGDGGALGPQERAVYDAALERERGPIEALVHPGDVVVLHDPQTVGLTSQLVARGAHVIWVCHIGIDLPNDLARTAWEFLLDDARAAAATVFTRSAYVWSGLDPSRVSIIPPCIDAGAPKNVPIEHPTVEAVLAAAGVIEAPVGDPTVRLADGSTIRVAREATMLEDAPVPATAPLVVQVSRWDRLKDPIGVLTGFATEVPLDTGAHLVLAGPHVQTVSDDPEGAEVLAEVSGAWQALLPHDRARTHLASLPVHDLTENAVVVNALQRRADVVVQKSLAEGFGLTVTEAMWKERPVVGSRLGGIAEQIEHGKSGLLVEPTDLAAFGEALSMLLRDEPLAVEIGHAARQRVRSRFLAPHFLSAHLELALRVAGVADP
ncbi:MAG TPA: glycosyltransferase [Actinomycetota bacterium]|nr:glycosyltransferase [Actinomycetota bacterium]